MANFTEGNYLTREAGADLSTKQHYIVKLDTNGKVVLASASTDKILGVLANAPVSGDPAVVRLINSVGTFKVKTANAGIAQGARLTSDSSGLAIATTTSTHVVFGRMPVASNANDIAEYLCDMDVIG